MWLGVLHLSSCSGNLPRLILFGLEVEPRWSSPRHPRMTGPVPQFYVQSRCTSSCCLLWVKCKCSHLQMQMPKMGQTMNTDDCRKNLKEWQENSDKEGAADWVNQGRIWKTTSWKVEPGCKPRRETSGKIPRHGAHGGLSVRCQGDAWRAVVASICRQCLEPARKANSLKFRDGERLLGWM